MLTSRVPLRSLRLKPHVLQRLSRRHESTYQPPTPQGPRSGSDRHREFYKTFGRPLAKNFFIAVATYQVLYFSWLKLESYETKLEGEDEVKKFEGELKALVGAKER